MDQHRPQPQIACCCCAQHRWLLARGPARMQQRPRPRWGPQRCEQHRWLLARGPARMQQRPRPRWGPQRCEQHRWLLARGPAGLQQRPRPRWGPQRCEQHRWVLARGPVGQGLPHVVDPHPHPVGVCFAAEPPCLLVLVFQCCGWCHYTVTPLCNIHTYKIKTTPAMPPVLTTTAIRRKRNHLPYVPCVLRMCVLLLYSGCRPQLKAATIPGIQGSKHSSHHSAMRSALTTRLPTPDGVQAATQWLPKHQAFRDPGKHSQPCTAPRCPLHAERAACCSCWPGQARMAAVGAPGCLNTQSPEPHPAALCTLSGPPPAAAGQGRRAWLLCVHLDA
jgi:hypothetical protein